MPYRFEILAGSGLRVAPGVVVKAGDLRLRLRDASGTPVPAADVEFHLLFGDGAYIEVPAVGTATERDLVVSTTDADGIVAAPAYRMGSSPGPNGLLALSPHASLEVVLVGTYEATRLEQIAPASGDPAPLAGETVTFRIRALDGGYGDAPVPDLPVEIEVTAGVATFPAGNGRGHYDLRRTSEDGSVAVAAILGRRGPEAVTIRFAPHWVPEIAPLEVGVAAGLPTLQGYSFPTLSTAPVASVPEPVRPELYRQATMPTPASASDVVEGISALATDRTGTVVVHPPAADLTFANKSFALSPHGPGDYDVEISLPDFPDVTSLHTSGQLREPLEGSVPNVSVPGPSDTGYVQTTLGGDTDGGHLIAARLDGAGVRYLGPNAVLATPFAVNVVVTAPGGPRRLVEARFRAKVRLSPTNSAIDDSGHPTMAAGAVATAAAGPWADEIELTVDGAPGAHRFELWFRADERNFDNLVDITAKVSMEDLDAAGQLVQFDEDSTLQLRAAVLRPRLSFTRKAGSTFLPLAGEGVRPVTLLDRAGSQASPADTDLFYVEARCHDLGGSSSAPTPIVCRLSSGTTRTINLSRVERTPEFSLYRSAPCFAYADGIDDGGPDPVVPPGFEAVRADLDVTASVDTGMPGNTASPPNLYSTGRRPLTWLALVEVGDSGTADASADPVLRVDIGADLSVPAALTAGRPTIALRGHVYCAAADLGLGAPTSIDISGTTVPLTAAADTPTFGRPNAWSGLFDASVPVPFGLSLVTLSVRNALGRTRQRRLRVLVREATNNLAAPASVSATVRPLPGEPPERLPYIRYLYGSTTAPLPGNTPPASLAASLSGVEAYPGTGEISTLGLGLSARPGLSPDYASPAFLGARTDLAPLATPVGLLTFPPGGRVEWACTDLPNAVGVIGLTLRRQQLAQQTTITRKDASGVWVPATGPLGRGDVIRVEASLYPDTAGGAEAVITFTDPSGRLAPGPGRVLHLDLAPAGGGRYVMAAATADLAQPPGPAGEILIAADGDAVPAGVAAIRVLGLGRIVAGQSLAAVEMGVSAAVTPRRTTRAGADLDQEGLRAAAPRLGALATVVAGTGELVVGLTDRRLPGRGPVTEISRTYRSGNDYPGPLGHGWNPSWNAILWHTRADEVRLLRPDGQIAAFTRSGTGWAGPPGLYGLLTEANDQWQLSLAGGYVETYQPVAGLEADIQVLVAREDRFGNRTAYSYPSHGRLAAVREALGRTVQLRWSPPSGRLVSLGDWSGCELQFEPYAAGDADGAEGNLKRVRSPIISNPDNPYPDGRSQGYGYDGAAAGHRLLWLQDAIGIAGSLDHLLDVTYTADGHVETQRYGDGGFAFVPGPTSLAWTDRMGHAHRAEFDAPGAAGFARRPARVVAAASTGTELTHRYEYNSHGEITRHVWPMGNATTVTFDEAATDPRDRGNVLQIARIPDATRPTEVTRTVGIADPGTPPSVASPSQLTDTYTYVPTLGFVETATDALHRLTRHRFEAGILVAEESPQVASGGLTGAPQTRTRQLLTSRFGQPLRELDPTGVATRFWYFPADDPVGAGGSAPVSSIELPGGMLAAIDHDIADAAAVRSPDLGPVRTVRETFSYDDRGNAVGHVDGRGMVTRYEFNELDELTRAVGPELEERIYRYDPDGRLSETLHRIGDLGFPADLATSPGQLVRDVTSFNRLGLLVLATRDADGLTLTTRRQFDANENLAIEYPPMTMSTAGARPKATIHTYYDDFDRRIKEVRGEGSGAELVRGWAYDDNGDVTRETYGGLWGRAFVRDGWGRVIARSDDIGSVVETHLDDVGNVARLVVRGSWDGDPAHIATLQEQFNYFDEADRMVATRERSFVLEPDPTTGNAVERQLGSGRRLRRWAFDAADHQVSATDIRGVVSTIGLDGHALPITLDDGLGGLTRITYDGSNNPLRIEQNDGLGQSVIVRAYDNSGRPIAETVDGVTNQQIWYDTAGRPRVREDALGNRTVVTYDGAGRVVTVSRLTYDRGRRVNPDGTTNALRDTLTGRSEYDDNGNLVRAFEAAGQLVESFTFDERELVVGRTLGEDKFTYGGTTRDDNPGPETYRYGYRADGLLETITDPEGHLISQQFDAAGRLTGRTIGQGTAARLDGTTLETYVWDGLGRLLTATDDNGAATGLVAVRQRYASLGGVVWTRIQQGVAGIPSTNEASCAMDELGQRQLLSYPTSGRSVRLASNQFGATDRVTEGTSGSSYAEYGYHGRFFSYRRYPNGLTFGYGYNARRQVQEIRTYRGQDFIDATALVTGHRYVYDEVGLPIRDQDLVRNSVGQSYYDSLYQLTAQVDGFDPADPASIPKSGSWTAFDRLGNATRTEAGPISDRLPDGRLVFVDANESWSDFNAVNELGHKLQVINQPGQPATVRDLTATYDRRGNLVADGLNTYRYDYKNRLVAVSPISGGPGHTLHYDALDRRIHQDDTTFFWFGTDLLEAHADSGSTYQRYIYGAQPGELVAYETDSRGQPETLFVHGTRNGNTEFLTGLGGDIAERYAYDAFGTPQITDADGKPQVPAAQTAFPFLLHGHHFDPGTGLYSVGPRAYHPFLGRFVQRDPGGALEDPAARGNAYTYAANNPAAFTDRHGSESAVAAGAWAFGGSLAKGVGFVGLMGVLSASGPVGLALAGLLALGALVVLAVQVVEATSNRMDEARLAGHGNTPWSVVAAVGDVIGISVLYEAYKGRRIDSNLPVDISSVEVARTLGSLGGQITTLFLGPWAFRRGAAARSALRAAPAPNVAAEVAKATPISADDRLRLAVTLEENLKFFKEIDFENPKTKGGVFGRHFLRAVFYDAKGEILKEIYCQSGKAGAQFYLGYELPAGFIPFRQHTEVLVAELAERMGAARVEMWGKWNMCSHVCKPAVGLSAAAKHIQYLYHGPTVSLSFAPGSRIPIDISGIHVWSR